MEKKLKSVQLKKRIALQSINSIERFVTNFSVDAEGEIPEVLDSLERHKDEFFDAMTKLEELDDSSKAIDASIAERIAVEERYRKLKAFLRGHQRKDPVTANLDFSVANSMSFAFGRPNAANIRLPKIELPSFDGDVTKWLSFRDRFLAMIDSSQELPMIAKLQYLLSALKGEAALPFEHVSLTAENYSTTWAALLKRFDNPKRLIREYYRKLHHLPSLRVGTASELMQLIDEVTRSVNGMLDDASLLAWEKHSVHHEKDKYRDLLSFLEDRIQILKATVRFTEDEGQSVSKVSGGSKVAGTPRYTAPRKAIANTASASHPSTSVPQCPLVCTDAHSLRSCPVFGNMDVQQRREIARTKRLCWNCLSSSHRVKACKSSYTCRECHERHHSLLHQPTSFSQPNIATPVQTQDPVPSKVTMAAHAEMTVFLETVRLNVIDDFGNAHEARALLDSGSMANFMSESFARKLLTTRSKVNVSISGIGQVVQVVKGSIIATVQAKLDAHTSQMEFLVLEKPSADVPTSGIDVFTWNMPSVTLADPTFHVPGKIDMVIGGDTYWELHSGQKQSLGAGRPWLVETPFGWVVAGNVSEKAAQSPRLCQLSANIHTPLELTMQRFWECETIDEEAPLSTEEDRCERWYTATTTRDQSGRYIVRLPRTSDVNIVLGASREMADRRLKAVERRLDCNPDLRKAYSKFMQEYACLGHMKKLLEPIDDSGQVYYLPHHAVVKESSTTTKVRVVFDASSKSSSGYSLNDTLLVGPVVQQDLYTIMMRFRSNPIALVADIEKMYRQILHDSEDKRLLRIRYREDSSSPIETYELQTRIRGLQG
ncbi:uncharacterized protein LOC131214178 [Anopheles bellator]|uniref:uncharacterized protein LOC131214178 n=1 Tax=Anopheles bellator TaxID=139047 RepID=UPI002647442B|nr:uncharacterized protein LOC131214178 [Anopheles bellator]